MERINNVEDVLRILETDYKILSVKDTVKVRVLFEEVEVPLDLWTQAIMLQSNILYERLTEEEHEFVGSIIKLVEAQEKYEHPLVL